MTASTRARAGWFSSPPPSAAIEITAARVTAASIGDHFGNRVVTAYASEPLLPGVVEPALNAPNVHDAAALTAALKSVMQKVSRPRRVALVVPDSVAKVSLVRFDKVPPKASDLDQMVRWQVRKAAPFRLEDSQISWQPGVSVGGGREFVVTQARRDVVESYERACEAAGGHAGIIDLASFSQINAVLASGAITGDWLLVHIASDYATLAVVRSGVLVFFRNRATMSEAEMADFVHQTAMYHEDRLGGGGFSRVVLAGASVLGVEHAEHLGRLLEERIGTRVEPIDFRGAVSLRDRIAAGPELLDGLAPSLGVLLRERVRSDASGQVA